MWKKILVLHDFSQCAARALEVAVQLARQCEATLAIAHVSPLPPNMRDAMIKTPGAAQPASIEELLANGARRELTAIAAPLKESGLSVKVFARATAPGSAAAGLLELAAEVQPDVIVMGTHGRRGISHLLLGSVAEQVIRGAQVPVVTVRSSNEQTVQTREESLAEDELAG